VNDRDVSAPVTAASRPHCNRRARKARHVCTPSPHTTARTTASSRAHGLQCVSASSQFETSPPASRWQICHHHSHSCFGAHTAVCALLLTSLLGAPCLASVEAHRLGLPLLERAQAARESVFRWCSSQVRRALCLLDQHAAGTHHCISQCHDSRAKVARILPLVGADAADHRAPHRVPTSSLARWSIVATLLAQADLKRQARRPAEFFLVCEAQTCRLCRRGGWT
jgi:hypothetical protein